ncbi:hypothetical protein [Streptomyces sp. NBC_00989]|uniref:hypothetical protein n=1 Tax=Streptomyces sp. NBC_00989 TaxID=2903705 RepID=UPI002F90B0FB|nr:hypothetical protein OG714_54505 [Streptomyces sp. NBC_00989]
MLDVVSGASLVSRIELMAAFGSVMGLVAWIVYRMAFNEDPEAPLLWRTTKARLVGTFLNVQRVSREHFFSKPSSSETTPRRRRDPESRVGVKLRLISLVLPAGVARERYLEEWMDERNGIRRGIFPKRRFWALTVLFGAIGQSYESRVHARRQVD